MAWSRIAGDLSSQHGTDRRDGFAGSRTEVTDGGEECGPDIRVGVVQAGGQHRTVPGATGRICPRPGPPPAGREAREFDRQVEQRDDRPADLCQCLGDLIDAATFVIAGHRARRGARSARSCRAGTRRGAKLRRSSAVKSDSSSGAMRESSARRSTSKLTTASRTRSSS